MSRSNFKQIKDDILASLGVVDYSPKGSVDKEIVPLINLVNSHPTLVTTSSCAGRVSIFIEGSKDNTRIGGKGDGGAWLFFTHDPSELRPGWINGLHQYVHPTPVTDDEPRRYILYKFEPFILHVKCADHESAAKLYSVAMACGFRETGIGPYNLVAIRTSMRLDVPIGYLKGDGVCQIVPDDYLGELDRISLELFKKNFRKIDELTEKFRELLAESQQSNQEVRETKEERWARKRKEGLERSARHQSEPAPSTTSTNPEILDQEGLSIFDM